MIAADSARHTDEQVSERWLLMLDGVADAVADRAAAIITHHRHAIAAAFYEALLGHPDTRVFLSNELVSKRLRFSLADWIETLFAVRSQTAIETQIRRHREIGTVHARINLPMHLVQLGFHIIKQEVLRYLVTSDLSRSDLAAAVQYTHEALDLSATVINDTYLTELVRNTRTEQAFKLYAIGQKLEVESQRIKIALYDWLRQVLIGFCDPDPAVWRHLSPLVQSEFGLWMAHKGNLLFQEASELQEVMTAIDRADRLMRRAADTAKDDTEERQQALAELNGEANRILFLLEGLVQRNLELAGNRDPLTQLLNRRFLPSIIQKEVALSIRDGRHFAILLLDIDHFKRVNDTHGHGAGDAVLRQFAEIIANHVRANDFVFRYGGEEVLVLLTEVDLGQARHVAEKLRQSVEQAHFTIENGQILRITTSIGGALHTDHPDFNTVIDAADTQLYRAKTEGRNRVCL